MATLATSNISTSLVRSALGESSNKISDLCKSSNINMFSKRKPVRDSRIAIPLNEVGTADNYGIVIPVWDGTNQTWAYNKPRGIAGEPFRLGDFRGYFHEAGIPIKMHDYTGYVHMISYDNQLEIIGISSTPDESSPGIAIGDVLPGYYFAAQLTNELNETVWGTNEISDTVGIIIDFAEAPFNTSNWRSSAITIKFFMSSVQKTFAEADKTSIKKALHYDASNKTTQVIETSIEPYIDAEISGIRPSLTTGLWLEGDTYYDPEDPPLAMSTGGTGGVALKFRLYNKLLNEVNISGTNFRFGTNLNYHDLERYLSFINNIYDLSGNAVTSINIQPESWSDYFIVYDAIMLSAINGGYEIPSPVADDWVQFYIKMNILGTYTTISNSFRKRCTSA